MTKSLTFLAMLFLFTTPVLFTGCGGSEPNVVAPEDVVEDEMPADDQAAYDAEMEREMNQN